jgi:hypothetical protein
MERGGDMFASVPDAIGLTWELTRPGARCIDADLLPRVRELDPEGAKDLKEFSNHIYYSSTGEVMMAFTLGGNVDESRNAPAHLIDVLHQAADEHLRENGVEPDDASMRTVYSEFRKMTSVTEEQMVEAFKDDLDSIFQTWQGTEGGET